MKLCGNFLIASSIEAIGNYFFFLFFSSLFCLVACIFSNFAIKFIVGEAMALSEKHGVDREKVMDLLSSTIFNCLIYKGYGNRVSKV